MSSTNQGQPQSSQGNAANDGKKVLRPCCVCKETRIQRDECMILNGEESCGALIEAHKKCLREHGGCCPTKTCFFGRKWGGSKPSSAFRSMNLLHTQEEGEEDVGLRPETLAILNEFLAENNLNGSANTVSEDWQLSQFWYSEETCKQLVNECISALDGEDGKIACISCPSLVPHLLDTEQFSKGHIKIKLFEFDQRFQQRHPDCFVNYDYNRPLDVPKECAQSFNFIIADPPFLSDECFIKVAQTVRFLERPNNCKLLFATGTIMEEMLHRLFKLKKTQFKPVHKNNLANDFSTFTSYKPRIL